MYYDVLVTALDMNNAHLSPPFLIIILLQYNAIICWLIGLIVCATVHVLHVMYSDYIKELM